MTDEKYEILINKLINLRALVEAEKLLKNNPNKSLHEEFKNRILENVEDINKMEKIENEI